MSYPAPSKELTKLSTLTTKYINASRSPNTRRSYLSDWRDFDAYCVTNGLCSLPCSPETLIGYIVTLAETKKVSTILRHISSISQAHSSAHLDSPTRSFHVHAVIDGIKRTKGCMVMKKAPIVAEDMTIIVAHLGNSLIDTRDKALMLLGLSGAFRRSELTALTMDDIVFTKEGIIATLRRGKTDQSGHGRHVGIPYGETMCPVAAVRAWIDAANIKEGSLFRSIDQHGHIGKSLSDCSVARIVKKLTGEAGFDASCFAGHSLRSGFITTAAKQGVSERDIMSQSGHRNISIMRGYIHDATLFKQTIL